MSEFNPDPDPPEGSEEPSLVHDDTAGKPGSETAYRRGCRCPECTAGHKERSKRYYEARKGRGDSAPRSRGTSSDYEDSLKTTFEWAGMGLAIVDPLPGVVLERQAPKMAASGNKIIQRNNALKRFMARYSKTTIYAQFVGDCVPVIAAVLLAHMPLDPEGETFRMFAQVVANTGVNPTDYLDVEEVEQPSTDGATAEHRSQSLVEQLQG